MKYMIQQMQRQKAIGELKALKASFYDANSVAQENEYKQIREKLRRAISDIEEIFA